MWFRVRTFMPPGFDYTAEPRLKFLRIATKHSDGSGMGHNDIYLMPPGTNPPLYWIYEGNVGVYQRGGSLQFGNQSDQVLKGAWETYEFYVKFDTEPDRSANKVGQGAGSGQGRVKVWKNGKLLLDHGERTLKDANGYVGDSYIFTYWNKGSPATQEMYVDDVVITTDVPSARDSNGNPFIGVGNFVSVAPPNPPASIQ